jgi:hypothetical protein
MNNRRTPRITGQRRNSTVSTVLTLLVLFLVFVVFPIWLFNSVFHSFWFAIWIFGVAAYILFNRYENKRRRRPSPNDRIDPNGPAGALVPAGPITPKRTGSYEQPFPSE